MNEDEIDKMVERFLGWRIPEDFSPDGGVTFSNQIDNQPRIFGGPCWPTGTNLLNAQQAREMIKHMLGLTG